MSGQVTQRTELQLRGAGTCDGCNCKRHPAVRRIRVFGATFLVFSDYMRPAIRLSSLMKLPVVYVLTHDSIYVGKMGPHTNRSSIRSLCASFLTSGFTVQPMQRRLHGHG